MNALSVWAIVLCHNGVDLSLQCLADLAGQSYTSLRVLAVDNGSTDGTAGAIRSAAPQVELIYTGANLGYTGGNNLGIRYALAHGADAVLLLNNDVRLAETAVAALAGALRERPAAGAVGPMVYTWGSWEKISSAGGAIDWAHADAINVGAGERDAGQYGARAVDFVNGCAICVRREAIERAGLLDERYFMYWDETDWCTRIRRAGYQIWFEPAARIQHRASIDPQGLSAPAVYYMARNRMLFFGTHTTAVRRPGALAHAGHGLLHNLVVDQRMGRRAAFVSGCRALRDALLLRWGQAALPLAQPPAPR